MGKRGETKRRILDTARLAFNEHRYGRVTTASLAARLEISEGNLWYHFPTKRDLLDALQGLFLEEAQADLAALQDIADPVAAYIDHLKVWRALFARYVFIFRDRSHYGDHSADLAAALPAVYAQVEGAFSAIYAALIDRGDLALDKRDIAGLLFNVVLITRFYFEFLEERDPHQTAAIGSSQAVLHHLSLLNGRLDASVLRRIESALTKADA